MKRIAFLLALIMLLATYFVGCDISKSDTTGNNDKGTADTTIANLSNDSSNNSYLNDYSVVYGNDGEYYIYIRAWDEYRKIEEMTTIYNEFRNYGNFFDQTSSVINEKTAAIAIYNYDNYYATVNVYHFNRDNDEVISYTATLPCYSQYETYCSLLDTVFINMIDENKICFFGITIPEHDVKSQSSDPRFLIRLVSEDGGKTWSRTVTPFLNISSENTLTIAKFASREVGIISFRYVAEENELGVVSSGWDDLFDGTYITTDGGLSWDRIHFYHSASTKYPTTYARVLNFSRGRFEDAYEITVTINNDGSYTYYSTNLMYWEPIIGK